MSLSVASFSTFAKTSLFDDFTKDPLEHSVTIENRAADGLTFEPSLVFAAGSSQPRGTVKTNFSFKKIAVKTVLQTDASKVSSIALSQKNALGYNGLTLSSQFSSSDKDFSSKPSFGLFGNLGGAYTRDHFSSSFGLTTDGDAQLSANASAAVGFEGVSVGGDVKFVGGADRPFAAKSYNAGITYARNSALFSLVTDAKFDKIKLNAVFANVVPNTTFGAQAKIDVADPKSGAAQRELILSLDNQASKQTKLGFRLTANTGTLITSVEHTLRNPAIKVAVVGVYQLPLSPFLPCNNTKFGVQLTFLGEQ